MIHRSNLGEDPSCLITAYLLWRLIMRLWFAKCTNPKGERIGQTSKFSESAFFVLLIKIGMNYKFCSVVTGVLPVRQAAHPEDQKWGRKCGKFEEKWEKVQEIENDWGNISLLLLVEAGYGTENLFLIKNKYSNGVNKWLLMIRDNICWEEGRMIEK